MNTQARIWLIGILILLTASLSALHSHIFSYGLNFDVVRGQCLIGAITFASIFIIKFPKRPILLLRPLFLVPLLFAILFSWGELVIEFDSHNSSKGWGFLWLLLSYVGSCIGLVAALFLRWIVFRFKVLFLRN